jgi:drug/metabolite transporter (DMT)-like permease
VAKSRRIGWGPLAWPVGSLVGVFNVSQLLATLKALALLHAVIVFPLTAVLSVVLNTAFSIRFWGERLDRRALLGMVLAILSAVLLAPRR